MVIKKSLKKQALMSENSYFHASGIAREKPLSYALH